MSYALIQLAITRIPKSPGWEPVPVLVRKWAAQQKVNSWWGWRVKLYLPLPIAHLTPEPPHPLPHSWKNCLLGNQFLMPKRLGTAVKQSTPKLLWHFSFIQFSSVQFSSVAQSSLTPCDPINRSTPGLPEFTQTHVHQVSDAYYQTNGKLAPNSTQPPLKPWHCPWFLSAVLQSSAQHIHSVDTNTSHFQGNFNCVRTSDHIRTYCETWLSLPRCTV